METRLTEVEIPSRSSWQLCGQTNTSLYIYDSAQVFEVQNNEITRAFTPGLLPWHPQHGVFTYNNYPSDPDFDIYESMNSFNRFQTCNLLTGEEYPICLYTQHKCAVNIITMAGDTLVCRGRETQDRADYISIFKIGQPQFAKISIVQRTYVRSNTGKFISCHIRAPENGNLAIVSELKAEPIFSRAFFCHIDHVIHKLVFSHDDSFCIYSDEESRKIYKKDMYGSQVCRVWSLNILPSYIPCAFSVDGSHLLLYNNYIQSELLILSKSSSNSDNYNKITLEYTEKHETPSFFFCKNNNSVYILRKSTYNLHIFRRFLGQWTDRMHQPHFSFAFRQVVFYLMCCKEFIYKKGKHTLPLLPIELWLHVFMHLDVSYNTLLYLDPPPSPSTPDFYNDSDPDSDESLAFSPS